MNQAKIKNDMKLKKQKWKIQSSEIIFDRVINEDLRVILHLDVVKRPDGTLTSFIWYQEPQVVAIFAVNDNKEVALLKEYRHAFRKLMYNLPGGFIQQGENPKDAAIRELREETGFEASVWEYIGCYAPDPGKSSLLIHTFVARQLRSTGKSAEIAELEWVQLTKLKQWIRTRKIEDPWTVISFLLYSLTSSNNV